LTRSPNGQIKLDDLAGKRFGRLKVIRLASKKLHTYWFCRCDCRRAAKRVRADSLLDGSTLSCGCLATERRLAAITKHGKNRRTARSPVYSIFFRIRNLCRNPEARDYLRFGGRGCEFLFDTFQQLIAAVGEKPGPAFRLERVDPEGHYAPGNLHWIELHPRRRRKSTSRRRQVVNPVAHKP